MNKILCGGISPESEVLLTKYLNHFISDYTIEPLSLAGIRGKMKREAVKPDCIMAILDIDLYSACESTCKDILALPKVHKYVDEDGFAKYLESLFGVLDEAVSSDDGVGTHGILHEVEDDSEDFNLTEEEVKEEDTRDEVIQQLREKLTQAELSAKNLQAKVDENDEEISGLCAEIRRLKSQTTVDTSEVESLNTKIAELTESLSKVQNDYKSLEEQNKEISKSKEEILTEKNNIQREKDFLQSELDALRESSSDTSDADALQADIINLKADLDKALKEVESLKAELEKVTAEKVAFEEKASGVDTLEKASSEKDSKIQELEASLKSKDEEIQQLHTSVADNSASAEKLTELEESIKQKDAELQKLHTSVADTSAQISKLEESVKSKDTELQQLHTDVATKDTEVAELKAEVEKKDVTLAEQGKTIEELKQNGVSSEKLKADLEQASNTIIALEKQVELSKGYASKISSLESENTSLRSTLESTQTELSQVKSERDEAKLLAESSDELRSMYSDLEMELAEKDAVLSGVFGQMNNMAIPKAAYGFNLPKLQMPSSKFVLTCAGSSESTSTVYYLLKKSLQTSGLRALIVDLTTDTCIDSQFGASGIKSPIPWLAGEHPFTSFIADTKLPNVKIITTALSYLNELFLLKVDWASRIADLQGVADVVVFNIGNINGVVQKVLYSQFVQVMQTSVIVKATPLNLRTLILGLTGLNVPKQVKVVCTDYDNNASKGMYKKLSSKYTAQILKDTDILKL